MAIKSYSKNTKKENTEPTYNVLENFGKLDASEKYPKELRLISWNDGEPKYDLRPWTENEDGTERCFKGLTFTATELEGLLEILKKMNEEEN